MVTKLTKSGLFLISVAAAHDIDGSDNHHKATSDACTTFSEFALVLDESKSITSDDWKDVKKFASEIVQKVGLSSYGNRAGIASFSDRARIRITCKQHNNTKDFTKAIDGFERHGTYTNMEDGLIKGI